MRSFQAPGRSPVYATEGMAATSHPLSTQVALDVLKADGNAMDAAIAACAVQCVVEPQSTGIGGDCFCLYAPGNSQQRIAFNGSGKAPAAASTTWYAAEGITDISRPSVHSIVVPGAVDAWFQLNRDHGRMPMSELLQPAIRYAKEGYPITPRVHFDMVNQTDFLHQCQGAGEIFLQNGKPPSLGSLHHQPALAATLEVLATKGVGAFYSGDIAEAMVSALHELGGLHTLEDFAAVSGNYVTPITTEFRGHTVYECPPNGQGVIALLLLNMMAELPAGQEMLSVERIHAELEACRRAYRVRNDVVADPAYADVPVEQLLSAEFAARLAADIDPQKAATGLPSVEVPEHQDTVYISVVDKDRNACSFINTLFSSFGSGVACLDTGVVFTNRAQSFSLNPDSPNCIAGGKRPLHTIIPALLEKEGQIVMCFGVMGGHYQAMGHMQFLTRYLDYGLDIQQAQDAPRFMVDPSNGSVEIEEGVDDSTVDQLAAIGHEISRPLKPIGGSQAIAIDREQGVLCGGSDPRKDGAAMGY